MTDNKMISSEDRADSVLIEEKPQRFPIFVVAI